MSELLRKIEKRSPWTFDGGVRKDTEELLRADTVPAAKEIEEILKDFLGRCAAEAVKRHIDMKSAGNVLSAVSNYLQKVAVAAEDETGKFAGKKFPPLELRARPTGPKSDPKRVVAMRELLDEYQVLLKEAYIRALGVLEKYRIPLKQVGAGIWNGAITKLYLTFGR